MDLGSVNAPPPLYTETLALAGQFRMILKKKGIIMAKGDMMLPVKTDKDIIRYLREALRIQEHNTNNMAAKYCKIYKMYKAYRRSKRQAASRKLQA